MITAADIKNVKFGKSMSGYKQEEVEVFLDKLEAGIAQYERVLNELQAQNNALTEENTQLKNSQNSIQSVLLSAQQLADKIVKEAKEKSEEIIKNAENNISVITAHEKELSSAFELKANERKAELQKELDAMIAKAKLKADSITSAANDSVYRQQILFDKLKLEIATFKTSINSKYKEHLEILASIPDSVPSDPKRIAEIVATAVDKQAEAKDFISVTSHSENAIENSENNGFAIKEELPVLEEEEE